MMVHRDDFAFTVSLDMIVRELHAAGYRAVVVGGAVRDAF